MTVVTRFAPSPTGLLHIGGARTALFNWLYARHAGGRFLLRIEDTDRKRSTPEAIDAIFGGLSWLGLRWDDEPVYQYSRRARHAGVAQTLVERGLAYRCYCTPEELAAMRERAKAEKRSVRYDGTWRDRDPSEAPPGIDPVVRFRAPEDGVTTIDDAVQGRVELANAELDDLVLLRADGTPTYMLSVVVDDHDMGITHAIRGDDHLTNAFRQTRIFQALGWTPPVYAHVPLIHGPDGARLSKRHGALGVEAYREMGILPQALLNYLCRLGWSHGDDEMFALDQATEWFDIADVNKGAARFDLAKLRNLNGLHIAIANEADLVALIVPHIEERLAKTLPDVSRDRLHAAMTSLKSRAKTVIELVDTSMFYVTERPLEYSDGAARLLDDAARRNLAELGDVLAGLDRWTQEEIERMVRAFCDSREVKLGKVAQPLRAALTGADFSPGIFEVAAVLGRGETLGRIDDAATGSGASR